MTGEEEGIGKISEKAKDMERARDSLIEELEAVNRYMERAEATKDNELKKILIHNMNEEKEHIAMLIEYIRKRDNMQNKAFLNHD